VTHVEEVLIRLLGDDARDVLEVHANLDDEFLSVRLRATARRPGGALLTTMMNECFAV
jgi:hypothetical protein